MSILIDENTKVVVQGLTGREGQFHALRNRDYGTKIVAGTRPGKGGENVEGIPIFDDVEKLSVEQMLMLLSPLSHLHLQKMQC